MRRLSALFFTLALTMSASAQNNSNYTFLTPFDATCTTKMIFAETLSRYGEVPIMRGHSLRNINGAQVAMNTVLFMNHETGSWTMAEQMSEDAVCVVAMGQNWHPYFDNNNAPKSRY
jgi:hypothetical protein